MSQIFNMIGNSHFFEGVEKLVEVWFSRRDGVTMNCDLRKIPRSELEMMLQCVKCEIISSVSTDDLDAYVLSESSMFISKHRFILKTCGTTTPLDCLSKLISVVQEYAGYDMVQNFFYSRKNYKRPDLQVTPHRSFEEESEKLDRLFPDRGGKAYCLGSMNGEDCWYLYVISSFSSKGIKINLNENRIKNKGFPYDRDQTLEVLMTNVSAEKMKFFHKENFPTAVEATERSGIASLLPNMIIDDYQFEPCGYSMNGVSKTVEGGYMTIHITPEPEFSYVSFETNVPHKNYPDLINRVVELFDPKQFVVTFFSTEGAVAVSNVIEETHDVSERTGYFAADLQMCRLPGYDLSYALYNRFPS